MSGDPPGRTLCPVDSNDRLVGVRAVRMLSPIDFNDRVRGPQMLDVNSRLLRGILQSIVCKQRELRNPPGYSV